MAFSEKATDQKIYVTVRDIEEGDNRIYGTSLDRAIKGQGPNCFPEKIGKPLINEFFSRFDRNFVKR